MKKGLTITLGVTALIVFGFVIVHFNPLYSLWLCSEQTLMEKTSPDGRYVAVLMRRSCRATEPPTAHIKIRLASSRPFPNHFSGGPINDGEIFGTSKYSGERFCWSSPRRVEIDYLAGSKTPPGQWADVITGGDYAACR